MSLYLAAINVYPVKSCAPVSLEEGVVQTRGLAGDRRWMVVAADNHFITGRQEPRLTQLRAGVTEQALHLAAEGMGAIEVAVPVAADGTRAKVVVWRNGVEALVADEPANRWMSRFLGRDCRLVYMDAAAVRSVDPQYGRAGDEVSFADAFPLLLTANASLRGLNERLPMPVSMLRFRPNVVIEGGNAHDEDSWQRIRIGAIEFEVVKPCSRCVFTTIDPDTGLRDATGEPLRTLTQYRQVKGGVMFGMNLIPRASGVLRVGDRVEVQA